MSTLTLAPPPRLPELIELRQQAHYWRALHGRAVEREQEWKGRCEQLEAQVRQQAIQLEAQRQQIEGLTAQVAWLQQQVFGRKSEATTPPMSESPGEAPDPASSWAPEAEGRRRGKPPGAKGYGRKPRLQLPSEEVFHALPEAEQRCPHCGKPFEPFPTTEDSEEIHWEVRLLRRVHKRARYRPLCDCRAVPGIVTAPVPAKLIPKGLFSTGFWVQLLLEKFLFQRPRYRIGQRLALEGLCVSQGTLTGGRHRLGALVQPLYGRILEHSRSATHWQMDETRWLVFAEVEGKERHLWWLWVVVTQDTCAYLLDPSRSSEVAKKHLGEAAEGIVNADRFSAYKALGDKIRIAFCWRHIRRDFVRIRDGYEKLQGWAEGWIKRINELFGKNAQRLAVRSQAEAFAREDQEVRAAVAAMAAARERELADPRLPTVSRTALESLRTHWEGATLFVAHPEIPMDNNEAERCLRNPVVGRKNYYGSGAVWSGMLSAMLFTLFQTCLRNQIDPQQFLLAFFEACAQNGGQPPEDLEEWLPWKLSEAQKHSWAYPKQPP
jgi:transposase